MIIKQFTMADGLLLSIREYGTYFVNGQPLQSTHRSDWKFVAGETEVKSVTKQQNPTIVRKYWRLRASASEFSVPATFEDDDVKPDGDGDWTRHATLQSLYERVIEREARPNVDVAFQIELVGESQLTFSKPTIFPYKVRSGSGRDAKEWEPSYETAMPDAAMFPTVIQHQATQTMTAETFYKVIRNHVQQNIDRSVAKITSDYDFCFRVVKLVGHEPYSYQREILNAQGKSYRKRRFKTINVANKEVAIFSMTHKQTGYQDYDVISGISAPNLDALIAQVGEYLDALMAYINEPVKLCDCCNGTGAVVGKWTH